MDIPAWMAQRPGLRTGRCVESITTAVLVRDEGDVLLVDCGFSRETCNDPRGALGTGMAAILGVRLAPDDAIAVQLEARGIAPSRVKTVVATHLHLDHVGGLPDFPAARLVCTDREWAAFHASWWPPGSYRMGDLEGGNPVDALALDGPPHLGFPGSRDLFGDGSVVLLDARGHTRGHAAVALRTGEGTFVHTGDASDLLWEYQHDPPGPSIQARFLAWSTRELVRTYASLRACVAAPEAPVLVPTHDPEVFERLSTYL